MIEIEDLSLFLKKKVHGRIEESSKRHLIAIQRSCHRRVENEECIGSMQWPAKEHTTPLRSKAKVSSRSTLRIFGKNQLGSPNVCDVGRNFTDALCRNPRSIC